MVRAGALPHLKAVLQPNSSPVSDLWASRLLKALAQVSGTALVFHGEDFFRKVASHRS
mgnify:CR=1 FL=1